MITRIRMNPASKFVFSVVAIDDWTRSLMGRVFRPIGKVGNTIAPLVDLQILSSRP